MMMGNIKPPIQQLYDMVGVLGTQSLLTRINITIPIRFM